jgi:Ca2+-binding RTX toxin-like protein
MSTSAAEQYLLELMNRARLDPSGEAALYGIDLNAGLEPGTISNTSKQVLAPNQCLQEAATEHSQWMLSTNTFSHTGGGGSMPWDRAQSAGYSWLSVGENIAWVGTTGTLNLESAVNSIDENLFRSSGHRENLMNDAFREVGVSVETGNFSSGTTYNAAMVTELFGLSGSTVYVTGVTYTETDMDQFYSMGEGLGGMTFVAQGNSVKTESAGGYSLGVSAASAVSVTGKIDGQSFACTLDMTAGNVKLDIVSSDTFFSSGSIVLETGINNVSLLGLNGLSASGNDYANVIVGNDGNNLLSGLDGDDIISGAGGKDQISGGEGRDKLCGQGGVDLLEGGNQNDTLVGGSGADSLIGGAGKDRLIDGGGADVFIFAQGDSRDTIKDFSVEVGDMLRMDEAMLASLDLTENQIVNRYADVVDDGVLFDFGDGQTIMLCGLTTTSGLSDHIDII